MIDLLQGTYASAQSRYMLAALPAAYLLAAVGLGCLGRPIRVVVLLVISSALGLEIVNIYRKDSRSWQPLREVARGSQFEC